MNKEQRITLAVRSGAIAIAILSASLLIFSIGRLLLRNGDQEANSNEITEADHNSLVLQMASLTAQERKTQLMESLDSKQTLERSRARYILANDYISQYEGGLALQQLKGLDKDYPVLAPYILLKRGRAYELTNDKTKAQETWKQLLQDYPQSPVVVEALAQLGKYDRQYWQTAIAQFPHHPRTHELIRQLLKEKPNNLEYLTILIKYDPNSSDYSQNKNILITKYSQELDSDTWGAIANNYWDNFQYQEAAKIYNKAPHTAQNFYREGRSNHISGNKLAAKAAYLKLLKTFPDAQETGLGLRRLALIVPSDEAIKYLNLAIQKFPKEAPEALLQKIDILSKLNNTEATQQAYKLLLTQYTNSEAAAEYRWKMAEKLAKQGKLAEASQWAQQIAEYNPDTKDSAKAVFWIGKWQQQLNRTNEANTYFHYVIKTYPQSYYAWRSAVILGWNVGDFNTVRQLNPQVITPNLRPLPPAGSEAFQELYRLGQDYDAWLLFQGEIAKKAKLDANEQFTLGLLKLAQGKNLQGINLIWKIREDQEPQNIAQWQQLRQTSAYWYALFPMPFGSTIFKWSQQRQLNPLLVTSLIRQESRFEPEIRSSVGAAGLMQVMPGTGEWVASKIKLEKYSLTNPEDNINLGTWYLDYTHQEYNNNSLLAVASYNAGPGNVAKWIKEYQLNDPDIFVEQIPFDETRGYVESVFSNYWNYMRLYNPEIAALFQKELQ